MYKVLLVDDEPYAIEGLRTMYNWEKNNFSVCGVASDGKTALEYINYYNPDLVITDIKMPELDGLQLIQYATEVMKTNAKFIILSGYDNFSFAQAALKYGVCDYLLKPLDIIELNEVITKVIGEIKKQENIQKTIDRKLSYIVNNSVNRLLSGEHKESIIKRLEFILNIKKEDNICCMLLELDISKALCDYQQVKNSTKKIIETLLGSGYSLNLFEDCKGRFCIILSEKMEAYKNPYSLANIIKEKVSEQLFIDISTSISNYAKGVSSITEVFTQASAAIQYRFYLGKGNIIYYKDIADKEISNDFFAPDYGALINFIKANKKGDIKASIDLIFNEFTSKNISLNIISHYFMNLQAEILSILKTTNMDNEAFIKDLIAQYMKIEYNFASEVKSKFLEFAYTISDYIFNPNEGTAGIIEKIKEFVIQNYSKNIKLQTISETFSINSVYLGQLFKKTTGMYFNEYLHFIRIEEAKKLLRRTDMKITDISSSLGYNDSEYFVSKFKAFTSITPSEYKKTFVHP